MKNKVISHLIFILLLATCPVALADTISNSSGLSMTEAPLSRLPEDPYARSYVYFELARNFPVSRSQERFESGPYHPAFMYLHNLNGSWLMGLGGQYKIFKKKEYLAEESDQIAMFTVTHEALYSLRLYHPAYLLMGPKLHYLFPAKTATMPLQRDPQYETEIGAAFSIMIAYAFADQSLLTVRIDRWRGTKTTLFQGVESSLGFAYAVR